LARSYSKFEINSKKKGGPQFARMSKAN